MSVSRSAELFLEAVLVDLQRSDLRFEGGSWNTEFFSGAARPINTPPALAQGCLDNRLFLGWRCSERVPADYRSGRRRSAGEPTLVHRKNFRVTHNHRSLDHVL